MKKPKRRSDRAGRAPLHSTGRRPVAGRGERRALSRCRTMYATTLVDDPNHATAAAARHAAIAVARKSRWVFAEMRWRWTLKVL